MMIGASSFNASSLFLPVNVTGSVHEKTFSLFFNASS